MKKEYDFSKGERGKFYRENAQFSLPIYLEEEVYNFVQKIAESKNKDILTVVSELLKNDMKIVELAK